MLRVIGAGWGRTGTSSIQAALGMLGYRTHHMREVFANPGQAVLFTEAADDSAFDWERVYGDYDATVDFPGCVFWRELADFYPQAKVLLTTRPSASYYASYAATIPAPMTGPLTGPTVNDEWDEMIRRAVIPRAFGDADPSHRSDVIDSFERHNDEVRAAIPGHRLLEYSVTEGWGPLAEFLDEPTPDDPFPHLYRREEWARH